MTTDWESVRDQAARIRAQELWMTSPEGIAAMEPFERIKRLEARNAKLRKKLERYQVRHIPHKGE